MPFSVTLLLLLPFLATTFRAESKELDAWTVEHFQLARQAHQTNDLDVAAKEYQLVLSRNPKFAEGYLNLGIVYHQQKNYRESVKTLQTAISLKPDMLSALVFLGIGRYLIQDFKGALVPLQKALGLNPKERQAGIYLGSTFIALENPEKAIHQLRRTARHFPEDQELSYHLGEAYTEAMRQSSLLLQQAGSKSSLYFWAAAISAEQRDAPLQAIEWYLKALAYDPNISELYLRLGIALKKSGLPDLAAEALRIFVQLNPSRDLGSLNLDGVGEAHLSNDPAFLEHKKTFERLWQALPGIRVEASVPNVADAFVNQALRKELNRTRNSNFRKSIGLYLKGDYRLAAQELKERTQTSVDEWASAYVLARSYLLGDDQNAAQEVLAARLSSYFHFPSIALLRLEINSQLALKCFDQVIAKQPESFRARILRAKYYAASNQPTDAIAEYQEILNLSPDRTGIHLGIGQLQSDRLDWPAAIQSFQAELALNPDNALALAHLGHAYTMNRDADKAIEVLRTLLKTHPTDGEAYLDLGKVLAMNGETRRAIKAFEQALLYGGGDYSVHYRLFQLYNKVGEKDLAQMHLTKFKEEEAKKRKDSVEMMASQE